LRVHSHSECSLDAGSIRSIHQAAPFGRDRGISRIFRRERKSSFSSVENSKQSGILMELNCLCGLIRNVTTGVLAEVQPSSKNVPPIVYMLVLQLVSLVSGSMIGGSSRYSATILRVNILCGKCYLIPVGAHNSTNTESGFSRVCWRLHWNHTGSMKCFLI
jgi:hypothetical protein